MTTSRAHDSDAKATRASERSTAAVVAEFTEFYRDNVHVLGTYLRRLGASVPVAADIAQEVMIQAYRQWSSIQSPAAWVRRVARKHYFTRIFDAEQDAEQSADLSEAVELGYHGDFADSVALRVAAYELLARLPLRQRQVMALSLDGLTPTEIAQELRITPGAVRSSLAVGKQGLGDMLNEGSER